MLILYNFFIRCYQLAVCFATFWNPKAKAWVKGRKDLFQKLTEKIKPSDEIIWIHCASAGEFEQGKPIIESLKQIHPHKKVLVSFFSPSGYAAGKKYNKADIICFLPVDTRKNAERFLKTINPQLAVFVKYEYWYHHLKTVRSLNIPLLLISAIFRREQVFFKRYGTFYKRVLQLYTKIFVQDEESKELLNSINIQSVISGDTRFDRVATIAKSFKNENSIGMQCIKIFAGNSKIIVAGSTWADDEKIIAQVFSEMRGIKLIIVTHEISKQHTDSLQNAFSSSIKYSD
ncbi:MAG TPA: glycosyltransferase N-terminal domain-containing protein, partial [Chitinophagaceae bacterium]|nr:glycosyltransferase N-terminal domain-containing protein [Chitinophagaceae bacterium]